MNKKSIAIIFYCVISLLLVGCGTKGGLITSLEDLTTESIKEGLIKVPQYRVISVPGLLPFVESGSLHFYKARRKPSSAVGLSVDKSYVLESVINSECDNACLVDIRDKILKLRSIAERVIEAKLDLTKVIATAPDQPVEASVKSAYESRETTAQSNYRTKRDELDRLHREVVMAMNHSGLLIYRWNTTAEQSGTGSMGGLFGVSGNNEESYSGFALVSGLRISTLYLGKDFLQAWSNNLDTDSRYSNRFELTTHVMQAQHIIYISEYDLKQSFDAKLSASYAQLSGLDETIKALDQIEIEVTLSKLSNLSNMGVIGDTTRSSRVVDWSQPAGMKDLTELNGWQTFFAVKSDMTNLMDLLKLKPAKQKNRINK